MNGGYDLPTHVYIPPSPRRHYTAQLGPGHRCELPVGYAINDTQDTDRPKSQSCHISRKSWSGRVHRSTRGSQLRDGSLDGGVIGYQIAMGPHQCEPLSNTIVWFDLTLQPV